MNHIGEAGQLAPNLTGVSGLTWTPARVGLFYKNYSSPSATNSGYWDWYDEDTS
jgi:hypothetical protein